MYYLRLEDTDTRVITCDGEGESWEEMRTRAREYAIETMRACARIFAAESFEEYQCIEKHGFANLPRINEAFGRFMDELGGQPVAEPATESAAEPPRADDCLGQVLASLTGLHRHLLADAHRQFDELRRQLEQQSASGKAREHLRQQQEWFDRAQAETNRHRFG